MDLWILLLFAIAGVAGTVEVHFENKDGGFFLKHSPRQFYSAVADLSAGQDSKEQSPKTTLGSSSTILSIDRFTVFQTSQPVSIRATYGPFSTKQTVPARYIVPDLIDSLPLPDTSKNVSSPSVLVDMDLGATASHNLDMSAHLVRNEIPRDSPVLRVLFHTGSDPVVRRQLNHFQKVCIILHASMGDRTPLTAACSPDGEDGVCLGQITIPPSWWVPLSPPDSSGKVQKFVKTPQRYVQVSYSVLEPSFNMKNDDKCIPRVQIQPVTPLAAVPLVPARESFKEIRADDTLTMLLPHAPLYPLSKVHVPVFVQSKPTAAVSAFDLKARVKSGLRILGVELSSPSWNITAEINGKQTVATVTCFRKESGDADNSKKTVTSTEEIFSWHLEVVENGEDLWDGGRIVWSARYIFEGSKLFKGKLHHHRGSRRMMGGDEVVEDAKKKLTARLEIQKDDIQSVLPISKNWEVINSAVLTGRQVSQAMKVLIVSQAGKVADVTLQSSCHSEDESVLKVSSSCSSVYVDGSEIRGSSNASVLVKYGTYTGLAKFTVWMPEFPLEVNVPDFRLSQIKGWKIPDDSTLTGKSRKKRNATKSRNKRLVEGKSQYWNWATSGGMMTEDVPNGMELEKHSTCRLRFQQSPIEVYARFLAEDHDSGRVNYFVNRRTWLRVTDLVQSLLRVSDPRIASLRGRIIQGRSVGRTEVQVLSPITGRVIGAKEVRVGNDKVTLLRLHVNVVSGLQLSISPDSTVENGYIAETSVTRKLTAQYQEGLLDIELEFSDESRTPLRDIAVSDYYLMVDSLDPDVVAFAPMVASHHPRVIAVGEGRGDLLRVVLLPNEECRKLSKSGASGKPTSSNLAQTMAVVEVDFGAGDVSQRSEFVQNDGNIGSSSRERRIKSDLGDILHIQGAGIPPLKDENNHEPTVQARQHHSAMTPHSNIHHRSFGNRMTPLEIGMYVLLAAFCFAIVVFVVSCVVYASKFKAQIGETPEIVSSDDNFGINHTVTRVSHNGNIGAKSIPQSTTNVHDWVWLGRATLEKAATHTSGRSPPVNMITTNNNINNNNNNSSSNNNNNDIRITENPLNSNDLNSCFENSNNPNVIVDTSTFCKNSGRQYSCHKQEIFENFCQRESNSPPPPPPPPHGVFSEEYKPPVPPHRTSEAASRTEPQPPKRHHHHHHHRNKNGVKNRSFRPESSENVPSFTERYEETLAPEENFDDEDVRSTKRYHKQNTKLIENEKNYKTRKEDFEQQTNPTFVQLPIEKTSNSKTTNSEVKKATIVGNPMFSMSTKELKAQGDILGLEDLNLGMDYDQIMQYFDNLKESNA